MFDYLIIICGYINGIRLKDEFHHICDSSAEAYSHASERARLIFGTKPGDITLIACIGPDVKKEVWQ